MFLAYSGLPKNWAEDDDCDPLNEVSQDDEQRDEGSREERTFRMWLNSLGCETYCASLFGEDLRCGWLLLQVVEAIRRGSVDWSQAFQPPFKNVVRRIKSVENCNQVLQIAKEKLYLSLVGIGGDDIADGKRKPILALVWQLMRFHTLQILRSATQHGGSLTPKGREEGGFSEADVLEWANEMLKMKGSKYRISSFRDPEISKGLPLLELLKSIEEHAVQDSYVTQGVTDVQKEMNAKYIISVARKLGSTVFIVWDDIVEVQPKMILILLASLMLVEKQRRKMHRLLPLGARRGQAFRMPSM